jgi:hypothetical protein
MQRWLAIFIFFFGINAYAESCKIGIADLSEKIKAVNQSPILSRSDLKDSDSGEPIRRYAQMLPDSSLLVVEQKNCEMYNLAITLLLPSGISVDKASQSIAKVLIETDVWQKWFSKLNATQILQGELSSQRFKSRMEKGGTFSYSLGDKIKAENETSEVSLGVVNLDSGASPIFSTAVTLYVGVGGAN